MFVSIVAHMFNKQRNKYMIKYKLALLAAVSSSVLLFTGCCVISEQITSDAALLDKAKFATGVRKENLVVVKDSITSSIDAVQYKVQDKKGNVYRCYFTSAVAITSDALCSKLSDDGSEKPASEGNCNALLKAAGRC